MFDNPKKELERLEQQLLAAEEDFDGLYDDEFDSDDTSDDDFLPLMYEQNLSDRQLRHRSAGFDAGEGDYEMDSRRYVPVQKKKGVGGLVFIAILESALAIAMIAYLVRKLL